MQMTIAVREMCLVQSTFDKEARSIFGQAYSLNWEYCIRPVGICYLIGTFSYLTPEVTVICHNHLLVLCFISSSLKTSVYNLCFEELSYFKGKLLGCHIVMK